MAIQLSFTSKHGVVANKAIHEIVSINYDHPSTTAMCQVDIFQTLDDRKNGKEPLERMEFTFTPSVAAPAANFLSQAYTALKKLSTVKDEKSGNDKSINYGGGKDVDI